MVPMGSKSFMSVTERTLTVGEGGNVTFQVASPAGARVRVLVLEASDEALDEVMALARLQEGSGFARQVLADPAEDVWNDL
jgi:hypothetical protein